ncbi:MAG: MoaD/ThiS family protein [Candidatus Omnitrophica bacterium]|nr:MoaD/ThiS family protein [Candidatus Omnitrophota bacterium]
MSLTDVTASVTVRVLLFAQLKDRLGASELVVTLPSGSTGQELFAWVAQRHPKIEGLLRVSRLAANAEYVALDYVLRDHDDVAVIPPVSGG